MPPAIVRAMIDAVRNFLRLFDEATPAEERTLERLSERLDRLLIAYHESTDVVPAADKLPPSDSYQNDRQLMERCFPELGLYGWSELEVQRGGEVMVGDAIDDLADIRSDEHTSELQSLMHISYAVFCLKKKMYSHDTHIISALTVQ